MQLKHNGVYWVFRLPAGEIRDLAYISFCLRIDLYQAGISLVINGEVAFNEKLDFNPALTLSPGKTIVQRKDDKKK